MKTILIYYCKNEGNQLDNYILDKFKNSRITYNYKENHYYFSSLFNNNEEEIDVKFDMISFDDNLVDTICEILKTSYINSKNIANEPAGPFNEPEIYSEIVNYINKCSYTEDDLSSIFEFVANLFFRYLIGHKMKNGNKRLSFMFLVNLLRFFGYHFF